jgi:galactonate dehydratase
MLQDMRIAEVDTFLVDPSSQVAGVIGRKHWLFVRLRTDDGLEGWGECYTQLDRDRNIVQHVEDLARYVVGRDPFHIKDFTTMVYDHFAARRGSMDLFCAVSGIEQAMWDTVGKHLGVPVYDLLGGPCRTSVRVYANGWYVGARSPDEHGEAARAVVDRGFTALKFDPFPGPWRLYTGRETEKAAVRNVRAVREAVGDDVDILIEVHRRLSPMCALRVAREMEELHPFWFEEPVPCENLAALAEVRAGTSMPIVTGEALYTKREFREVFEQRAADIINPDVCNCGGILELKEIAAMAEPSYVAVAPHNYNSTTVGLAASLQAAAVMPNFLILEYFLNFEETGREISATPFQVQDGVIALPTTPGLGIGMNEKALQNRPFRQPAARSLPTVSGS